MLEQHHEFIFLVVALVLNHHISVDEILRDLVCLLVFLAVLDGQDAVAFHFAERASKLFVLFLQWEIAVGVNCM